MAVGKSQLAKLSDELAELIAGVMPCVVSLTGTTKDGDVSGSGFLFDDSGHVVTNWHVVDGAGESMQGSTPGATTQTAKIIGSDEMTDLAVLQLENPPGRHLELRTDAARLGELCVALGSPLGIYPESVSFGMVSGVARTIPQPGSRPIERAIQTDAAINPGNSGGPLVDVFGRVLGVNKCVDTRGAGLGFAIPSDTIRSVAEELIADGVITRASLGVTVVNRAVEVDGKQVMRLAVTNVRNSDSSLKVDDVILSIEGEVCDERSDLYNFLTKERIGKELHFEVLRGDKVEKLTVVTTKLGG
jgi:S1-C subfamily serine protease